MRGIVLFVLFALPVSADTTTVRTPALDAANTSAILRTALPLWTPPAKVNAALSQGQVERRGLFHFHAKKQSNEFRWGQQ